MTVLRIVSLLSVLFLSTPLFADTAKTENFAANTIVVHKPATDPSWGKVVQFQQDQAVSAAEHSKEILYKFVFQDDKGVIRTAIYHENSTGGGYWEVWIWDQP